LLSAFLYSLQLKTLVRISFSLLPISSGLDVTSFAWLRRLKCCHPTSANDWTQHSAVTAVSRQRFYVIEIKIGGNGCIGKEFFGFMAGGAAALVVSRQSRIIKQ